MKHLTKILILLVIFSMLVSCELLPFLPQIGGSTSETTQATTTTVPKKDVFEYDPDADQGPESDPYIGVTKAEFYENYEPATSYMDAYYRTLHNFMSGSIEVPDAAPVTPDSQPMEDGKYVRNTAMLYSTDGNTYYIIDENGNIVNRIFKGGAYITLEEVAAYVFAFGEIPANYSSSKSTRPSSSPWGEYLRLNHSKFSGSTSKYPYEPELPDISGCGGDLQYYEMDIGTMGTDTGGGYAVRIYNNGTSITRGAARIVYARYDKNGDLIIDESEKYLFYTYNHYNDFQEYLNYEGGWGEMFGNITGGGKMSSKYDYNPTPYVAVVRRDLRNGGTDTLKDEFIIELAYVYFNTKFYASDLACA